MLNIVNPTEPIAGHAIAFALSEEKTAAALEYHLLHGGLVPALKAQAAGIDAYEKALAMAQRSVSEDGRPGLDRATAALIAAHHETLLGMQAEFAARKAALGV